MEVFVPAAPLTVTCIAFTYGVVLATVITNAPAIDSDNTVNGSLK